MASLAKDGALPQAPDIERMLLGGILNGSISLPAIMTQLEPADFAVDKHQHVFVSLTELHRTGHSIDIGTLGQYLIDRKELPAVDGIAYLSEISTCVGKVESSAADGWCKTLRDKTSRRRLVDFADRIRCMAYQGDNDVADVLALSNRSISEITDSQFFETDLQLPADVYEEYGGLQQFLQPQTGNLVPSPWPELNWKLGGGYRRGEMVVNAARPAQGKSAKAMQQAVHSAFHGVGTVVYPLEMKSRQLLLRAISSRAGVDSMKLRRPKQMDSNEVRQVNLAAADFAGLDNLWISKNPKVTVGSIESSIRQLQSSGRSVHLCVIDYLQLIQSSGRSENRVQEISAITRALKLMAMELDIVVYLLSQLNRANETQSRRPVLSDLRESGSTEQDADIVEFLHWEKKNEERTHDVRTVENIIAKQREGPIDTVELGFRTKYCDFHTFEPCERMAA
jgi:replicative DNA helicase